MKRIFSSIVCALGLAGCNRDQLLSPAAYTQRFVEEFHRANPTAKVEIVQDLQLKVTFPGGRENTVFLDNGYSEYRMAPSGLADVLEKFAAAGAEMSTRAASLNPKDIVPVIKDAAWIAEIQQALRSRGAKEVPENVFEPLNDQLIIVYAEDTPKNLHYLTPKQVEKAGLKAAELRKLAVENLGGRLPKIELKGGNGVFMVIAGGNFEASLLLFEKIWSEHQIPVNGDYVVAIPARDLLYVTGSNDEAGIAKVRELVQRTSIDTPYRLTPDLFIYRGGRFQPYGK